MRGFAGFFFAFVIPRRPAGSFTVQIRYENNKFIVERRKLILEIYGKVFMRPEKYFDDVLAPEADKIFPESSCNLSVFAAIKRIDTLIGIQKFDVGLISRSAFDP